MNHLTQSLRRLAAAALVLLSLPVFSQLSGTYTIDPTGTGTTNYASFTSAVAALTTSGVSGPVTFNVAAGTYTEQIVIGAVTGSSSTNRVTFQKAPTATGAAVLTFASTSTNNYTVQLAAASNLTFKDLTLANTTAAGQTVGGIVEYGGSTANIQFINNTFNGNAGTNTSNAWGAIRWGSVPSSGYSIGVWKFIGNTFNNISYGVNVNGTTLINADSVIVQNNTINCSYYHVYTNYAKNVVATNNIMNTTTGGIGYNYVWYPSTSVVFSNNTMSGMVYGFASFVTANSTPALSYTINNNTITSTPIASTNYGIYISGSTTAANAISKVTIKNNNISLNGTSSSWGILTAYVNATVASPSEISNNMIAITASGTAAAYGIYPNHVANMNIDHNTVSVLGGSPTTGRGLYINRGTSATAFVVGALNVRNNIISNTGLGYAVEIASTANTAAMIGAMSNNAYQGNAVNPFRTGTVATNYTTLATWQAATTKDAGSAFGPITFYSNNTDLHVQNALANNIGMPLASITTDIDGQVRSATTPDAGADEYSPLSCISATLITVPALGGSTATIAWTTANTPVSYKVRYRTQGLGAWTTVAQVAATISLTGLTQTTNYEVQVKEFCSTTDSSIWSGSTNFRTAIIPNWIENFQAAVPPLGWTRATGRLLNPTVFATTSSVWAQDDYGNQVPNGTNGKSARVNIYSTGHFNWLISPSIAIPNNALSYQIEYDLALTTWNTTTANTMGVDDTLALVVSLDNGLTWNLSNTVIAYNAASTITPTGSHVIIPVPTAWKGSTIKLGWYSHSTVTNADNDVFVDNFEVKDNATCPITAVPTVPAVTTCGPQAVTLSATWANQANQHIWLSPTGVISGRGNTFTTPVLTASTTQNSRLIGRDNSVNAVSGGPPITLTNPAGGGGNFTNGMWFTATQPFMLDSATVKAFATANGGTIKFQVRISEKAGTHAASTGAQLYLSDTITVNTTLTTGELKRIPINIPVLTGSYYVNISFLAGTTGTLFRSTALPTNTSYPYALGGFGSLDSVQLGATTSGNTRIYYLFNWKMSAACLGPIVTTNVTYASVPSVTLPHVSGFATGTPCNWVASAAPGATWQGKASYTGNGYTATTLNGTPFVMVDDDGAGSSAVTPNSVLTTPSFPGLGYDTLKMKFLSVFKGGSWGGKGYLDVWRPVNGVFGWQTIDSLSADEGIGASATGWAAVSKTYNVTAYQSNQFKARFRYDDKGLWAGWWAIDQFELNGALSPTGNVRVAVTTDIYGSEVSWKIVNTANKLVYAQKGPFTDVTPYNAAAATRIDTVRIPLVGNFEFRLTDSYGDGLYDGTNTGTYIVQKLCAWGNSTIDTGAGANDYDPGGAASNVASYDSVVFNMDCRQPATYLLSVNMSQQTVGANGVHVAGNFQGWNPGTSAMTDANGDGIYEYTVMTYVGDTLKYKFINGNSWSNNEVLSAATGSCVVSDGSGNFNRLHAVATVADSAQVVCFGLCFNCAGVTFNVDMNQVSAAFTTPEVNGLWNSWCGNCNPLTDANGDGIWTTTLPLPVGSTQEYKFSADNWTIQEQNNPAAPCTNGNATYTNRVLVIPATDTVLSVVCWSSCTGCDVDVTLKVNMAWEVANNAISANGIHVAGDFQSPAWSPSATAMTDANNDGIYEVTFTVPANSSIQYKFINGNAWGADESVPTACVVPTTNNRGATFAYADSAMSPVCFGKCTDCAVGLGESLQNVSLFPNPTRGQFNLARMDAATQVEVSVLDLQGKVLTVATWNEGVDALSIDLSSFANGVYMVRMTSEEGSRTMRVSVQK